jgi:hypothetical protein
VTCDADVGAPKKKRKSLLQRFLEVVARSKTEILTSLSAPATPTSNAASRRHDRRDSEASQVAPCCAPPFYADCVNRIVESARRRRLGQARNGDVAVRDGGEEDEDGRGAGDGRVEEGAASEGMRNLEEDEHDGGDKSADDPSAPLSPQKKLQPQIVRMAREPREFLFHQCQRHV